MNPSTSDILKTLKGREKFIPKILKKYQDIGNPIPENISDNAGRIAFFPAQIASASSMEKQFYGLAIRSGLTPIWDEYINDKFSSLNGRKMSYIRPYDQYGNRVKLVNPNLCEGKKLSEIILEGGKSLVDYHHEKWDKEFSNTKSLRLDTSAWLNFFGDAKEYYYHTMIMYTFFGAKFWPKNIEGLYRDGEKESLVLSAMKPARERVYAEFGFYPIEVYFELVPTLT